MVVLKGRDIASKRMVIRIERSKSGEERYVMLSVRLLRILRTYCWLARPLTGPSLANLLAAVCACGTESHAPRAPDLFGSHFVVAGRYFNAQCCALTSPNLKNVRLVVASIFNIPPLLA